VRFTEADLKLFEKPAKAPEHKTLSGYITHTIKTSC
jgi:hypothetical protein